MAMSTASPSGPVTHRRRRLTGGSFPRSVATEPSSGFTLERPGIWKALIVEPSPSTVMLIHLYKWAAINTHILGKMTT